ncbi:MAG TPA: Rieske 2Fe-2S domain-containing protein [Nitrososphaeraceae archaeon]|jgi:ferredoxin-NADP reductase/nitrite reductase/ring-hydroxylating ferredoxin subunit
MHIEFDAQFVSDLFILDNIEDFVKVALRKEIRPSQMKEVQVNGQSVCVANIDGEYYAINNICTHEGGPLADGVLEGFEVECPWHQSRFDVRTGAVEAPPASEPETTYEVKVDGEDILVRKQSNSGNEQLGVVDNRSTEYTLVLQEKHRHEGTDVMSFKFTKWSDDGNPDQMIKRTLDYIAGQYAFFDIGGVHDDPKGPIRHFTLSSSPTEDFIMLSTRIRESPYKKTLASLEGGTKVKVKGPQGKFTLQENYSKSAVFLSGGIGVTPFRSMIRYATDRNLPIKIVMFDSNRNLENVLFKSDFDDCANRNKHLRIIYTLTEEDHDRLVSDEWKGEKGRIDKAMLMKYLGDNELRESIFYICGPPAMVEAIRNLLQSIQIPKELIKVEEFTGY